MTAIWWIRRDLRLFDNPTLRSAASHGGGVLPLFILDPALLQRSRFHTQAHSRQAFLFSGLRSLAGDLRSKGSHLIVRQGPPLEVLKTLLAETNATAIFAEEDYSPYARRRDTVIAQQLPLHLIGGLTVRPPQLVLKPDGTPYTVFTPYSKTWKNNWPLPTERDLIPEPEHLDTPQFIESLSPPDSPPSTLFPATETEARRRLEKFLSTPIHTYTDDRNRLDLEGTSTLSPYLRFGLLSARHAVAQIASRRTEPGVETWLNELIWREFYISILYHFPNVLTAAFNPALRNIPWRNAPDDLAAWQQGRTGYPIVDAAMRQLLTTGWMHNRARMIVASFLCKDLLIDWQLGEQWFMQHLVDGDPAANNGGWQWTAGVGTDAAPYFRIFNPILQSQKFDPEGQYIRRYVSELGNVPDKFIHQPWLMPAELQQQTGCVIGQHYPRPIVDRSLVKDRTLAAYKASRPR